VLLPALLVIAQRHQREREATTVAPQKL